MKILITAGGTAEPIDEVRSITNTSTGRSGVELAGYFSTAGASVTLLISKSGRDRFEARLNDLPRLQTKTFVSFTDLENALTSEISENHYDLCIHMAAVSDYSVHSVHVNGDLSAKGPLKKISSGQKILIELKPNPKLLQMIQPRSQNKDVTVVGFKLTARASADEVEKAVTTLFKSGGVHYVVSNDTSEIDPSQGLHKSKLWKMDSTTNDLSLVYTNRNVSELFFSLNTVLVNAPGGSR